MSAIKDYHPSKKYKTYHKTAPSYFLWSEFLVFPILPLLVLSGITYVILLYLNPAVAVIFNLVAAWMITWIWHGLKNATPNGSSSPQRRDDSFMAFVNVFIAVSPTFFSILMVLLLVDVGVYILVVYQHTHVFYDIAFYVWAFVVVGIPILFFTYKIVHYYYTIYAQAFRYIKVSVAVFHDPEFLVSLDEFFFLNTKNKSISNGKIKDPSTVYTANQMTEMPVSERNKVMSMAAHTIHMYMPKYSNKLIIGWYAVLEDTYYQEEIDFPYEKLPLEQVKYPLNEPQVLRGKQSKRIEVFIAKNGEINIQVGGEVLLHQLKSNKLALNEEQRLIHSDRYWSSSRFAESMNKREVLIQEIKKSGRIEKRAKINHTKFKWSLHVEGLKAHKIEFKDAAAQLYTRELTDPQLDSFKHLPTYFQFGYKGYFWLELFFDVEQLFDMLTDMAAGNSEVVFEFHTKVRIDDASVSFYIRCGDDTREFEHWQKVISEDYHEKVKKYLHNTQEHEKKNKVFDEIYDLMQAKDFANAMELCRTALQQDPTLTLIYFYEARLLWYTQGYEACYAKEAYFLEKVRHDPHTLAHIYNHYGCLLDEQKRLAESLKYFQKAADIMPNQGIYWANIAELHYKMRQPKKALHFANESIKKGFTSEMMQEILKNKGRVGV